MSRRGSAQEASPETLADQIARAMKAVSTGSEDLEKIAVQETGQRSS